MRALGDNTPGKIGCEELPVAARPWAASERGMSGNARRQDDLKQQRDGGVFRDYIRRLSRTRFWLSKWVVAAALAGFIFLICLAFVISHDIGLDTFLNYFALGLLIFVFVTLFYGIIAIHDVPYEIARHRDHPHQDAIHAAGWVSLFTLHAIWPFLWIWAMLYRPERGWGFAHSQTRDDLIGRNDGIEDLRRRVAALERRSEAGVS